jgi:hypothetical protein
VPSVRPAIYSLALSPNVDTSAVSAVRANEQSVVYAEMSVIEPALLSSLKTASLPVTVTC